jgi:hypothetical protein
MTKRLLPLLSLILVAIATTNLHSQAKFAIYGTAGGEKTEVNHEPWTLAGTFGIYYGFARLGPIALSGDARGDLSRNMNSALFGPRAALALPYFPIKPYLEVLGGVSNYNDQNNGPKNITSGTYRWVVGLDTTIFPHIDWRIDYSYCGAGIDDLGVTRHPQSATSGIVIRF